MTSPALVRPVRLFVLAMVFVLFGVTPTLPQSDDGWTAMPGRAIDIAINIEGQAYVMAPDGTPWRWDRVEQRWRRMSGSFVRIAAAEGNRPWAINADGEVYRYNGLWWESRETGVQDVAANAAGDVVIAMADGSIFEWYALRSEWRPLDGVARRLALGSDGAIWAIRPDGGLGVRRNGRWRALPGRALDIAAGPAGVGLIVDAERRIRRWDPNARRWVVHSGTGGAVAVAATPDGNPWAVLSNGRIVATSLLGPPAGVEEDDQDTASIPTPTIPTAPSAQASPAEASNPTPPAAVAPVAQASTPEATQVAAAPAGPPQVQADQPGADQGEARRDLAPAPETVTHTGPLTFVDTREAANRLAIGADGSVFGLTVAGDVLRWSNTRREFLPFPGILIRIAVDPDGHPWGLSALGRVFRHDGSRWRQVLNAAGSDLAIGGDGTVVLADSSGVLYRLTETGSRFARIAGKGVLVAVAPDGVPWTVGDDGFVQRCAGQPCTRFRQKAKSLAIGPDGRVWIVSDRDRLMYLDPGETDFVAVSVPGQTPASVASGPMGYPWVVTSTGRVFASRFFERDETADLRTASATTGDTVGTGDTDTVVSAQTSGFVFKKNMRFQTVGTDIFQNIQLVSLDAGNDGEVYGYQRGAAAGVLGVYNANTTAFAQQDSALGDAGASISQIAVTSDGDIWAIRNDNPNEGLWRERNGAITEFNAGGMLGQAVAVAPDDTVYAVFTSGTSHWLYSMAPGENSFSRFDDYDYILDVSVGPGQDIWIVDRDNYVRQWDGSDFVRRPANGPDDFGSIDVGSDGTVYANDVNDAVFKWNGANGSFDEVNDSAAGFVMVDDDGRPWLSVNDDPTVKRARD